MKRFVLIICSLLVTCSSYARPGIAYNCPAHGMCTEQQVVRKNGFVQCKRCLEKQSANRPSVVAGTRRNEAGKQQNSSVPRASSPSTGPRYTTPAGGIYLRFPVLASAASQRPNSLWGSSGEFSRVLNMQKSLIERYQAAGQRFEQMVARLSTGGADRQRLENARRQASVIATSSHWAALWNKDKAYVGRVTSGMAYSQLSRAIDQLNATINDAYIQTAEEERQRRSYVASSSETENEWSSLWQEPTSVADAWFQASEEARVRAEEEERRERARRRASAARREAEQAQRDAQDASEAAQRAQEFAQEAASFSSQANSGGFISSSEFGYHSRNLISSADMNASSELQSETHQLFDPHSPHTSSFRHEALSLSGNADWEAFQAEERAREAQERSRDAAQRADDAWNTWQSY